MKSFAEAGHDVVAQHLDPHMDGDRRSLCLWLSRPLAEVRAAGLNEVQQLAGIEKSTLWSRDSDQALAAAVRIILGGDGTPETIGGILWPGGDYEHYLRHSMTPPWKHYWSVVCGLPPGPRTDTRVVHELTWASRLVAGLLDEHWAEIVSEVSALDARAAA
jgi:hypothetical protein